MQSERDSRAFDPLIIWAGLLLVASNLAACSSSHERGDGGLMRDSGTRDSGTRDSGPADSGPADSGTLGAGCPVSCSAPEHARFACMDGGCDFACDAGWARRGDACVPELSCSPGLIDVRTRVTTNGNHNLGATVAVSHDVAAVFWEEGGLVDRSYTLYARFYDYPSLAPRTSAAVVVASSLGPTSIQLVPISSGFAVLYGLTTSVGRRCDLELYDQDGVRTFRNSDVTRGDSCEEHALAGSDTGLMVAWHDSGVDVKARSFDLSPAGVSGGSPTTLVSHGSVVGPYDFIAWHPDRSDYRIAYSTAGALTAMTATLSPTGSPTAVDIPAVPGFSIILGSSLVAAGPGYGLLFVGRRVASDSNTRYLVALDREANATGPALAIGTSDTPALAAGPYGFGLVEGWRDVNVQVYDLDMTPMGSAVPVAVSPSRTANPDIAWAGDSFIVAWSDNDGHGPGEYDIYLARVCPAR